MKKALTELFWFILLGLAIVFAIKVFQEHKRANDIEYRKTVALEYYVELQERDSEARKR